MSFLWCDCSDVFLGDGLLDAAITAAGSDDRRLGDLCKVRHSIDNFHPGVNMPFFIPYYSRLYRSSLGRAGPAMVPFLTAWRPRCPSLPRHRVGCSRWVEMWTNDHGETDILAAPDLGSLYTLFLFA